MSLGCVECGTSLLKESTYLPSLNYSNPMYNVGMVKKSGDGFLMTDHVIVACRKEYRRLEKELVDDMAKISKKGMFFFVNDREAQEEKPRGTLFLEYDSGAKNLKKTAGYFSGKSDADLNWKDSAHILKILLSNTIY